MKKLIFLFIALYYLLLQSCRENSNESIKLCYTLKNDRGNCNIIIKRKGISPEEFEEIYIDSCGRGYIISDTFYYKVFNDTLFSLATYDMNGKTYKSNYDRYSPYVPIMVPTLLEGDYISNQNDSALRLYFYYTDKEKYSYLHVLEKNYYNRFESFLWGTTIYNVKNKEMARSADSSCGKRIRPIAGSKWCR